MMRNILVAACLTFLTGCSSLFGSSDPAPVPNAQASASTSSGGSWFWPFGGSDEGTTADVPQLGVNSYLWRASLDTLNFLPLASADPVGGVIITDWYAAPANPDEHMKVTVYILDRRLRADALKVSVFRQQRVGAGWTDAQVNPDTQVKIENAILSRARELRLAATPQ